MAEDKQMAGLLSSTRWTDEIASSVSCDQCLARAVTSVCISKDLFGNDCVAKRCDEHACACRRGEKLSVEAYLARSN